MSETQYEKSRGCVLIFTHSIALQEIRAGLVIPRHPNLATFVGACLAPSRLCVIFDLIDGLDVESLYFQNRSPTGGAWRPPVAEVSFCVFLSLSLSLSLCRSLSLSVSVSV